MLFTGTEKRRGWGTVKGFCEKFAARTEVGRTPLGRVFSGFENPRGATAPSPTTRDRTRRARRPTGMTKHRSRSVHRRKHVAEQPKTTTAGTTAPLEHNMLQSLDPSRIRSRRSRSRALNDSRPSAPASRGRALIVSGLGQGGAGSAVRRQTCSRCNRGRGNSRGSVAVMAPVFGSRRASSA